LYLKQRNEALEEKSNQYFKDNTNLLLKLNKIKFAFDEYKADKVIKCNSIANQDKTDHSYENKAL